MQIAAEMARAGTECSGQNWSGAYCRFPWVDEVTLALIGYELCGTYLLDPNDPKGFRNTTQPLTSVAQVDRFLNRHGNRKGTGLARRALSLVHDGSHSPMETAMALQLTGPRRVGGMGLPPGKLNCHIATSTGDRWVDLGWKDKGVGVEYQGKAWHADAEADDRRRNLVVASGMNLFVARFKDLSSVDLFDRLAQGIARSLGLRIRVRDRDFYARRSALWRVVLPPIDRA
ncbi:MAG: hypothetical protein Q4B77_04330 [Coriobacteriaceae bacterium]|nr:hypothetical protein [Coriobacteriaceae bacterium]